MDGQGYTPQQLQMAQQAQIQAPGMFPAQNVPQMQGMPGTQFAAQQAFPGQQRPLPAASPGQSSPSFGAAASGTDVDSIQARAMLQAQQTIARAQVHHLRYCPTLLPFQMPRLSRSACSFLL